jgi:hypothetical protein
MNSSLATIRELEKAGDPTADFSSIKPWISKKGSTALSLLIGVLSFTDEARKLEQKILEATQRLEEMTTALERPIEVEQDIWVQLPPIKEFTVTLKLEYLGQAKPLPLPDELLEI